MAKKPFKQPTIFISHISEEAELASLFKTLIEDKFLGHVKVFVSSNPNSIAIGERWLDQISAGLKECAAMLVLSSPQSVSRPWINFEAGAGWTRGIEVVPICHSGMQPTDLPIPLKLLQAMRASDKKGLEEIFKLVARKADLAVPPVDIDALLKKIEEFEEKYHPNPNAALMGALRELAVTSPSTLMRLASSKPDAQIWMSMSNDIYIEPKRHTAGFGVNF